MRKIKMGILLSSALALMSSISMSSAVDFETKQLRKPIAVIDMSTPDNTKFSNMLKDYDIDNKVPPSLETLTKQVGVKDELQVFIPERSSKYFYYFIIDHPIATEFRKKFFFGVGNDDTATKLKSYLSIGLVEPKNIKNMDFYNNGILLTFDVKNSPMTVLEIDDRQSVYSVQYTFAYGNVLKVELMTKVSNESRTGIDKAAMNYVLSSYKQSLESKGYTNKSFFGWVGEESVYKKDNTVIEVNSNGKDLPASYIGYLIPALAVMTIYDKDIYENYADVEANIKNKDMERTYNKLSRILNN